MPALEGQFLKEISVSFAGENHLRTQKNTKQSSAQRFLIPERPLPKDPFFQLLIDELIWLFRRGRGTQHNCNITQEQYLLL